MRSSRSSGMICQDKIFHYNLNPLLDFFVFFSSQAIGPGGFLYLPVSIGLIAFFNYYYTFLQLEPKDLSEQLKKGGAAIPSVRPGRQTAEYVTETLTSMSILGELYQGDAYL